VIFGGLPAFNPPTTVLYDGTWPGSAGDYWILVKVVSGEDIDPSNDVEASAAAVTITEPDINYTVSVNSFPATANAGGDASGQIDFDINNIGINDGLSSVHWTAWMSIGDTDTSDGSDVVIGSGAEAGINGLGSRSVTVQNALWPATPDTDWYVVIEVEADDENSAFTGDNAGFDGPIDIWVADIDYEITAIYDPPVGERITGRGFSGSFDVQNTGGNDGTTDLHWVAYISTNDSLDENNDIAFDSNVIGGGLNSLESRNESFSGTWPMTTDNYYILIKVVSSEDNDSSNDVQAGGVLNVDVALVDYDIVGLSASTPNDTGSTLSESFTLTNIGADDGYESVFWTAHMSLGDTDNDDASDIIVASGIESALNTGQSRGVDIDGFWPATAGTTWYLVVEIIVADDINTGNNLEAVGTITLQDP
jgi:hypothetical protein